MKRHMDKKRVLIIEDEEAMQMAISEALATQGVTTLVESDGKKGLETALREHPDLILLDIFMPKMDGLAVIEELRLNEWGKTVPVIILTNLSPYTNSVINSVLENKPAYYLVKSDVKLEGIVDKIKEVLKIED
jgi:DNA-binding response OmpR family regulator